MKEHQFYVPREILLKLLNHDYHIRARKNFKGDITYCIYDRSASPIIAMKEDDFRAVAHLTKKSEGLITLDLRKVRSLHGNSFIKKLYKLSRQVKSQNHEQATRKNTKGSSQERTEG